MLSENKYGEVPPKFIAVVSISIDPSDPLWQLIGVVNVDIIIVSGFNKVIVSLMIQPLASVIWIYEFQRILAVLIFGAILQANE